MFDPHGATAGRNVKAIGVGVLPAGVHLVVARGDKPLARREICGHTGDARVQVFEPGTGREVRFEQRVPEPDRVRMCVVKPGGDDRAVGVNAVAGFKPVTVRIECDDAAPQHRNALRTRRQRGLRQHPGILNDQVYTHGGPVSFDRGGAQSSPGAGIRAPVATTEIDAVRIETPLVSRIANAATRPTAQATII